jgi:transposase
MISQEKRELISQAYKKGMSIREMTKVYEVADRTIRGLLEHERETGGMAANTRNCECPPALSDTELAEMKKIVEEQNDMTLEELKEKMHLSICISAISKILRFKLGFTYKKKRWR